MPNNVGVLNLEIRDDSEQAATGLQHLKTKLDNLKNSAQGYNLSNVVTQIRAVLDVAKFEDKNIATSLKNVGTFINSISAFSKIKGLNIDVEPIKQLKTVIGKGFNMGNAGSQINILRQALESDWNLASAENARRSMETIADGARKLSESKAATVIKNVADAIERYNAVLSAQKQVQEAAGVSNWRDMYGAVQETASKSMMRLNLQQFGGKSGGMSEGQIKMDLDALSDYADSFTRVETIAHTASDSLSKVNDVIADTGTAARNTQLNEFVVSPITQMMDRFMNCQAAAETVNRAFDATAYKTSLVSAESITATKNIELLTNKLNTPIKWRGLNEVVDQLTGVNRSFLSAKDSADVFLHTPVEKFEESMQATGNAVERVTNGIADGTLKIYQWSDAVKEKTIHNQEEWGKRNMAILAEQQDKFKQTLALFADERPEIQQQIAEMSGFDVSEFQRYKDNLVAENIRDIGSAAEEANKPVSDLQDSLSREYGEEMVDNLVDQYSKIDLMGLKLEGMKQALADDINANKADTQQIAERTMRIQELIAAIQKLKAEQEQSTGFVGKMRTAWDKFKDTLKGMFPTLTSMLKRFGQIARYRFLRAVLKQITSGAAEGIENVYRYSQIMGTSFAPAMDSAASSLAQMKNSIGAALAPALNAVIPIVNNIVNAFINLINIVNQFFAILGGQSSWTRAKPYAAKAFDDIKDSAKGASSAAKDLLADWDELNIIQSQNSGGGGGSSGKEALDFESMFEEVNVFDSKINDVATFLRDNFEEILGTVLLIKGGILAWRLSTALSEALPILSKIAGGLAVGATIGITLMLTDLTGKKYTDSGNVAWLIADALTGAVGSKVAGTIAARIAGGGIGWAVQGFTLVLSGAVNLLNAVSAVKKGKESEAWALSALGAIEAGIGAALVAKGILAASTGFAFGMGAITAVLSIGLAAYLIVDAKRKESYKKMAYDAFQSAGKNGIDPTAYLHALQEELDKRTKNAQLVVDTALGIDEHEEKFTSAIESLKALNSFITEEGLSEEDATKFKDAWDIVIEELKAISEISYQTIYAGLEEAIANGSKKIQDAAKSYRNEVLKAESIMNGVHGKMEKELEFLKNEIIAGTTDPEILNRYEMIYTELSKKTESGLQQFKLSLEEGARFDFSHGETPIEEAIQFIESMGDDLVQPAIDKITDQYNAEIEALNKARDELETAKRLEYIGADQYEWMKNLYDNLERVYAENLQEQLDEITKDQQAAFNAIANQAIEGYLTLDQSDEQALKSYAENVFKPIKDAIEQAGGQVPEELEAWISRGGLKGEIADAVEMARQSTREGIYAAYQTEEEVGDIDDALKMSIAYEVDLVGGDPSKITEDARKEIINTLYEVFEDPDRIIRGLQNTFGWSLDDILGDLDLDKLDVEELNDIISLIEEIRSADESSLFGRLNQQGEGRLEYAEYLENMNSVATTYDALKKKVQDAIDAKNVREEEIKQKTDNIASSYENMASRIKAAFDSINGIGFNFSALGLGGIINVNQITKRASGGYVKSGDLVMANENGNFEMMGRMGNQPVVANNQQIVSGISQGVATANEGVENRLSTIESLLTRVLQKEFLAKAAPSSSWGAMNIRSGEAYNRVTGG